MLSSVAARAACSVSVVAAIGPSCVFVAELNKSPAPDSGCLRCAGGRGGSSTPRRLVGSDVVVRAVERVLPILVREAVSMLPTEIG